MNLRNRFFTTGSQAAQGHSLSSFYLLRHGGAGERGRGRNQTSISVAIMYPGPISRDVSPPPSLGYVRLLGSLASPSPGSLPLGSALVGRRVSLWAPMGEALLGWDRNVVMRSHAPPPEKWGGAEAKERSHPLNE